MPEIQEVSWHRASGATGKHDEPGVSFISSIYGYWKGYSCMITPMHQHDRLYHITLGGLPSKNVHARPQQPPGAPGGRGLGPRNHGTPPGGGGGKGRTRPGCPGEGRAEGRRRHPAPLGTGRDPPGSIPHMRPMPRGVTLSRGNNPDGWDPENACLMEVVAFIAGEEHSWRPACTSPVLTNMAVEANDELYNSERQKLLEIAPELVGANCPDCEERRTERAIAFVVTRAIPPALRGHSMAWEAGNLEKGHTPQGLTQERLRAALRRYGNPNSFDHLPRSIREALRAIEDARNPGTRKEAAGRTAVAAILAARDSREDQGRTAVTLIRETVQACPHRTPAQGA